MGRGKEFAQKLIRMFASDEMKKEPQDRSNTPMALIQGIVGMTDDFTQEEHLEAIETIRSAGVSTERPTVLNRDNTRPPQFIRLLTGEVLARCPGCDTIGRLNDAQFSGNLSMKCDCGYHEIHDLRQATPLQTWDELTAD
jgi:hypothetical protein